MSSGLCFYLWKSGTALRAETGPLRGVVEDHTGRREEGDFLTHRKLVVTNLCKGTSGPNIIRMLELELSRNRNISWLLGGEERNRTEGTPTNGMPSVKFDLLIGPGE
jgi:hypothetical protein